VAAYCVGGGLLEDVDPIAIIGYCVSIQSSQGTHHMRKQKKHPSKKSVYVWGHQLSSGKLAGDQYIIGDRDMVMPEWWPTKSEARITASEGETPVKIKITWSIG
jgi:hypothetical protein